MHDHARRTEGADRPVHRVPAAPDRRAEVADGLRSPASIAALQRTVGNTAVARMVTQAREDGLEPGADYVQRSAVHQVLRSAGRPLDEPTRTDMEARLGADFSSVRVHSGHLAQRSATQLGARAYTSGEHVVIGHGGADRHTLAHELTHVIQQRAGQVAGTDTGNGYQVSDPADRYEVAAERNARRVLSGPTPSTIKGAPTVSAGGRTSLQRADSDAESELSDSPFHQFISGHGTFSENDLATGAHRSKKATFTVPEGMTVIMYAPPGAYLDNAVANRLERGSPPSVDEVEMVDMNGQNARPLPSELPWPYVYHAQEEVIDYRVKPPDRLKVEKGPNVKTVDTPMQLRVLVQGAKEADFHTVHYLCCGSSLGVSDKFKSLFPSMGWYVRLKAA